MSMLLNATVRESNLYLGLSCLSVASFFPRPLFLQPIQGLISSFSKAGAATLSFCRNSLPWSLWPPWPSLRGHDPVSEVLSPTEWLLELGHFASCPQTETRGYSWEKTHLKEAHCISRYNSYHGEIMASCVALTLVTCSISGFHL